MLGPRVDRRPNECGVVFQFDEGKDGEWYLAMYEITPGAASTDRARYLRDIILASKQTRHLRFGRPSVRVIGYGADIPVNFAVSPRFIYTPTTAELSLKQVGNETVYDGPTREVLIPSVDSAG